LVTWTELAAKPGSNGLLDHDRQERSDIADDHRASGQSGLHHHQCELLESARRTVGVHGRHAARVPVLIAR
jgi:hypothetical protein